MTKDKDKIKELFSDKLKDFQPEVPASLWAAIDDSLSQPEATMVPAKTKKSFVLRTVSVVASVAAILIAVFVIFDKFTPTQENIGTEIVEVLETPVNPEQKSVKDVEPQQEQLARVETKQSEVGLAPRVTMYTSGNISEKKSDTSLVQKVSEQTKEASDDSTVEAKKDNETIKESKIEEERKITSKEAEEILLSQSNSLIADNIESTPRKTDNFSLALSSNSNFQRKDISKQGGAMTMRLNQEESVMGISMHGGTNDFDIKHDQPVSFSIGVSKGIAPNLSLETGIVYTYLASSISSKSTVEMREKQKFHYLGIPVNLNYTFFRHRRFSSYLTIGGMIEKDIKGTTRGNINGMFDNNDTGINYQITDMRKSIKQSHPQFSVHSSLGMSYLLYNRLSVYGNIGAAYYIDASNEYRTIYSDREFQLDLNLGFRWNF